MCDQTVKKSKYYIFNSPFYIVI